MSDITRIAEQVTAALGGRSNINGIENCMTRLRITVASQDSVDVAALKRIEGVLEPYGRRVDARVELRHIGLEGRQRWFL